MAPDTATEGESKDDKRPNKDTASEENQGQCLDAFVDIKASSPRSQRLSKLQLQLLED